ncbi:uncharacterized protein B0H18DRAFT_1015520 [Fomitopsis serialis]|uniref:uncharacterized protein n=1 Tax=Fomitopsis serialis TaxID=139415 RepID=UPI002008C321|nr:uncharacterized protein B0H18DRAFT_1015520 [Neoantrodia serialis]KAH9923265.1 hypothetical protein B0H18DRAFT_1015520 [Neoantrodia serialis]
MKRAEIQQLAKREGVRANGKTLDIIDALVSRHPDGVEPLKKEQGPVRRSRRFDTGAEPKEEEVEEEITFQPAIYGGSISQCNSSSPLSSERHLPFLR